jgi:short-subunit dehydrogenase
MAKLDRNTALVTGASHGIGEAFARVLAENAYDMVLTALPEDESKLQAVAEGLESSHQTSISTLLIDLSDPQAPSEVFAKTETLGISVDLLVNNAGAKMARNLQADWQAWSGHLQLMINSWIQLMHLYQVGMLERGHGTIVNIASLRGFTLANERNGVVEDPIYAAAKGFMIKFSIDLSTQLKGTGLNVTAVCPGYTRTNLHRRAGRSEEALASKIADCMWMDADTVAREAYRAAMQKRTVYIPGRLNRMIARLLRLASPSID